MQWSLKKSKKRTEVHWHLVNSNKKRLKYIKHAHKSLTCCIEQQEMSFVLFTNSQSSTLTTLCVVIGWDFVLLNIYQSFDITKVEQDEVRLLVSA